MLEVFDIQFKNSIIYGMTYEQFWLDCPSLYYIYQDVYQDKIKQRDINNWQLGLYIKMAIGALLSEKSKYPNEPIFTKNENRELTEKEKQNERLKAQLFFENMTDYVAIKKNNGD